MNLQKVIDREQWGTDYPTYKLIEAHNTALDRITEAAKQPRVMKRWTGDCKPKKSGLYWIRDLDGVICVGTVSTYAINEYGKDYYTHWLELEDTPVLPEGDK